MSEVVDEWGGAEYDCRVGIGIGIGIGIFLMWSFWLSSPFYSWSLAKQASKRASKQAMNSSLSYEIIPEHSDWEFLEYRVNCIKTTCMQLKTQDQVFT